MIRLVAFISTERFRQEAATVLRFGVIGALSFIAYVSVLSVMISVLHAGVVLAVPAAFSTGTLVSFFGHTSITFRDRPTVKNSSRFAIVVLGGLLANYVIFYVASLLDLHYLWTSFSAFLIVPFFNFLIHRFWTYGRYHSAGLGREDPLKGTLDVRRSEREPDVGRAGPHSALL